MKQNSELKRSLSSSSSSSSSTATSSNTSITSSSSSASLSISSDSLSDSQTSKNQTSTLNIVLNKYDKSVLNEFEILLKQPLNVESNTLSRLNTDNNVQNLNRPYKSSINPSNTSSSSLSISQKNETNININLHRTVEINEPAKMVHSDTKSKSISQKPLQASILDDSRYEYISRQQKDEKVVRNTREPKTIVKCVNFRASSLKQTNNNENEDHNVEQHQQQHQHQQYRTYRSLSPNQQTNSSSVAYVIGQQPNTANTTTTTSKKSILINKKQPTDSKPAKVYFAQAIGHGQRAHDLVTDSHQQKQQQQQRKPLNEKSNDKKIIEIHSEPLSKSSAHKRIRSPSNCAASQYYNSVSKHELNKRDYNSLLHLANKASFRIRLARDNNDDLIMRGSSKKKSNKANRSHSVNYLYNKRQNDMRKSQNTNLNEIHTKNHSGFTTEDIEDIYMPHRLNQFESKLKASLDISDNSEQEEIKQRISRHQQTPNKRLKPYHQAHHKSSDRSPRIIINFKNATTTSAESTNSMPSLTSSQHSKSYLEEAKRKLEESRTRAYFYGNLNNKLKSSVTNVIKATEDLARNSDMRQQRGRSSYLNEAYLNETQRNQKQQTAQRVNAMGDLSIDQSFVSDDIDNVYMPWMMENYGRKLVIEALKRRNNTNSAATGSGGGKESLPADTSAVRSPRHKSPYVSQYYAQTNDLVPGMKRNDLWFIDKDIRRFVKRSRNQSNSNNNDPVVNMETEVSISDSETSSDDTRPIVPEKINKPDVSLKNKILKTINKSLLSTELTGIDLNMLKLNDHVRKTSRRVEKKALERDLELDLIRSFSCNHLADLRREDIRYNNLRINRQLSQFNSFTAEDISDLYMPKSLETFKLKSAILKEKKLPQLAHIYKYKLTPHIVTASELTDRKLVISPPTVLIKSPNTSLRQDIRSTLPPNTGLTIRTNPNTLFTEIMQGKFSKSFSFLFFSIFHYSS